MPSNLELFHTGVTVDDLEGAMRALTRSTGVTWRPIVTRNPFTIRLGGKDLEVEVRRVYSAEGPHYIELLSGSPAVWGLGGPLRGTHFGYWVDDVAAEAATLVADGAQLVMSDPGEGGSFHDFAVLRTAAGTLVELLPRSRVAQILND